MLQDKPNEEKFRAVANHENSRITPEVKKNLHVTHSTLKQTAAIDSTPNFRSKEKKLQKNSNTHKKVTQFFKKNFLRRLKYYLSAWRSEKLMQYIILKLLMRASI